MAARKHYRVWPRPTASDDDDDATYFAVVGPRINEYAVMDELAKRMQRALNAPPDLTPAERRAVATCIGFALAGEPPDGWSRSLIAALESAHQKLGG